MKKIKLNKGLNVSKESVAKLQDSQISGLKGGVQDAAPAGSCVLLSCDGKTKQAN